MKILHFKSNDDFDEFMKSKDRIQETCSAHLITYKTNDGNYFVYKSRYSEADREIKPSQFFNVLLDYVIN